MKLSLYIQIFVLAASTGTVAKPTSEVNILARSTTLSKPRQNVDWDFSLYQNDRCSGAVTRFSGAGDRPCQTGQILNGNALAFIKNFVGPDCLVSLYSDELCTDVNLVEIIDEAIPPGCTPFNDDQTVASYQVDCP